MLACWHLHSEQKADWGEDLSSRMLLQCISGWRKELGGVRSFPAGVCRAWTLDKQSIKLIVLEAGSLEWRKQVLGDDCRVLKLPGSLFCAF